MADGRVQRRDAADEQRPVSHDGKQEIEHGSGQQYRDAGGYRAVVERASLVRGIDWPFATVEKAHVTAERDRRYAIFGLVGAANPGNERLAEADRITQNLHAGQAAHEVMAVFVNRDEHADRDDKREQVGQEITHRDWFPSMRRRYRY